MRKSFCGQKPFLIRMSCINGTSDNCSQKRNRFCRKRMSYEYYEHDEDEEELEQDIFDDTSMFRVGFFTFHLEIVKAN